MYRQRVVCFLTSHAITWRNAPARTDLLLALRRVSDPGKLALLLPLVELLHLSHSTPSSPPSLEVYPRLLLEVFGQECAGVINEDNNCAWEILWHIPKFSIEWMIVKPEKLDDPKSRRT